MSTAIYVNETLYNLTLTLACFIQRGALVSPLTRKYLFYWLSAFSYQRWAFSYQHWAFSY